MPDSVESIRSAGIGWPVRAARPPHLAAPVDHRGMVYRLFLLGSVLVVLVKGVEAKVFDNLAIDFDPWAFGGLFVGQMLFDASIAGRRSALCIGLGVTIALLHVWPALSLNAPPLGLAAGSALVLFARLIGSRAQRKEMSFLLALGFLMPMAQQICLLSQRLTTLHLETFDNRAYLVDVSLGFNPDAAFRAAQLVDFLPSGLVIVLTYTSLTFLMTAVILWKIRANDRSWTIAAAAFVLAGIMGTLLYHALPIAGPRFAFPDGIPDPHSLSSAPAFLDPAAVRNGMPSLHAAWAFLIMMNAGGLPRWFKRSTIVFFATTLVATLATGQHYLVDLIVALPFALATQAAVLKLWHRRRMDLPLWFGILATAAWLFLLREHVDLLLDTPGATAAAMVATAGAVTLAVRRYLKSSEVPLP